jgi:hypothetical protein
MEINLEIDSLPSRIAVILANPRSGSTWLFDSIRCHPAVDLISSGYYFGYLTSSGRRYPRDLSPSKGDSIQVEIRPDIKKWADVPIFSIKESEYSLPPEINNHRYALEKIHPHFFNFDSAGMIQKVRNLESSGNKIKFIYLVRDPSSSMESFLNYQKRNSSWNQDKNRGEVAQHMVKIYQNIRDVALLEEGLILDYGDMVERYTETLGKVFDFLWPKGYSSDPEREKLIIKIKEVTAWEKRKTKKPFLGKSRGPVHGHQDFKQVFLTFHDELDLMNQAYQSLLELASKQNK